MLELNEMSDRVRGYSAMLSTLGRTLEPEIAYRSCRPQHALRLLGDVASTPRAHLTSPLCLCFLVYRVVRGSRFFAGGCCILYHYKYDPYRAHSHAPTAGLIFTRLHRPHAGVHTKISRLRWSTVVSRLPRVENVESDAAE
jgi:hypothetical protein